MSEFLKMEQTMSMYKNINIIYRTNFKIFRHK